MSEISKIPVSDFDAAVRLLSGGTNVAIYNDLGLPSIYVRRDKGLISDVLEGGPDTTHYAFKVNGAEIPAFYMGKYLATVYKGRALSLPLQDPIANVVAIDDIGRASSKYVNFDNAKHWCEANGAGFHLPTIAEYAWIALQSRKNDTLPRGNNASLAESYGYEKGVVSSLDAATTTARTLTGSGPASWNDNFRPDGICDLCGNVWEWQGGYRTVDGELQIFADNDAAMQYNQSAASTLWKAILQDGTLVEPGTEGTLKWDYTKDPGTVPASITFCLNTVLNNQQVNSEPYGAVNFGLLTAADGVSVPDCLKALALMPNGENIYGNNTFSARNKGEQFSLRGGYWTGWCGLFTMLGYYPRTNYGTHIGFRPAFIPGI